jgi:hypothetical protein
MGFLQKVPYARVLKKFLKRCRQARQPVMAEREAHMSVLRRPPSRGEQAAGSAPPERRRD